MCLRLILIRKMRGDWWLRWGGTESKRERERERLNSFVVILCSGDYIRLTQNVVYNLGTMALPYRYVQTRRYTFTNYDSVGLFWLRFIVCADVGGVVCKGDSIRRWNALARIFAQTLYIPAMFLSHSFDIFICECKNADLRVPTPKCVSISFSNLSGCYYARCVFFFLTVCVFSCICYPCSGETQRRYDNIVRQHECRCFSRTARETPEKKTARRIPFKRTKHMSDKGISIQQHIQSQQLTSTTLRWLIYRWENARITHNMFPWYIAIDVCFDTRCENCPFYWSVIVVAWIVNRVVVSRLEYIHTHVQLYTHGKSDGKCVFAIVICIQYTNTRANTSSDAHSKRFRQKKKKWNNFYRTLCIRICFVDCV